jgi:hypothetical protein
VNKLGCNSESDWCRTVAIALAHSGDDMQADFFHFFLGECRSWGFLKAEAQLASVNIKLSEEDKELIEMLGFREPA